MKNMRIMMIAMMGICFSLSLSAEDKESEKIVIGKAKYTIAQNNDDEFFDNDKLRHKSGWPS